MTQQEAELKVVELKRAYNELRKTIEEEFIIKAQAQAQTQFVEEENLSVNDREKAISEGYRVNTECGMSGGRIALYIFYVLMSFWKNPSESLTLCQTVDINTVTESRAIECRLKES